jgi:hypothetical protein
VRFVEAMIAFMLFMISGLGVFAVGVGLAMIMDGLVDMAWQRWGF